MSNTLLIIGAGGHARVIADSARESGAWDLIELYDDAWPELQSTGAWTISGTINDLMKRHPDKNNQVIVGIGGNRLRYSLQKKVVEAGWEIATIIHPSASISRDTQIGLGTVVMAGAVVNIGAAIGKACIINTRVTVDHDCRLGDAVHLSPGTTLSGTVIIGDRSWIGVGSSVANNLQIGADTIVGAGATVISDVPDKVLVVGTPAKIIKAL